MYKNTKIDHVVRSIVFTPIVKDLLFYYANAVGNRIQNFV